MVNLKSISPGLRKTLLVLIPITIGISIFLVMSALKKPPRQKRSVSKAPVVRVMQITPMRFLPRAYGYGTAMPKRVWKAIAQVSGKIIFTDPTLQKGKQVKKGTVLLKIDPSEYNIAISQLQTKIKSYRIQLKELDVQRKNNLELLNIQRQTLKIKEKEVGRQKRLFEQKMIAANTYEAQLQGLMAQQAQVQSIQNSLNLLPHQKGQLNAQIQQAQGDLANARLQLSYTEIKAPFDVQIASVNNESSEFIQKGQTIFVANDTSAMEIEAQFIPGSARPVFISIRQGLEELDMHNPTFAEELGISAVVRIPGDTLGQHKWEAKLNRFSDSMDTETRTMGLIFVVKNNYRLQRDERKRPLFSGTYCEVELRGKIVENALILPRSAIHPGNMVYLMTGDKKLEKRIIKPGTPIENFVRVRDGIKPGEMLILSDVIPAVSGMTVNPTVDQERLEKLKREAEGGRTMIRYFTAHPTAANLMMVVFIALGIFSMPELRRESFPEFAAGKIQVRVTYPGASAEEVEEAIVQRMEDALGGIENVKETTAQAMEGVGIVVLEMDEDAGDLKAFIDDIRTEVDAISSFPADAGDPVITTLARTDYVVSIAVTGPMSATDLKDYTESLKRKMTRLPEISLVSVTGFSDRQIRIQISSENLMNFGLNIQTIAGKIVEQNLSRPVGSIETDEQEISLRFKDQRRTPDAYRSIVIFGGKSGAEIRLGDIATVEELFENDEIKTIFNNERAGVLVVNKTRSQDTLVVLEAVKRFIDEEQANAPPGVKLTKTRDMASIVKERLDLLITNGWQGLLLVFFSLWLFFSFRLSFWVTMGLPISFAGAIFVMNQIGYTLNMMTTVALIITLGLLMDDAIVIAENVASHLQKGKTALNAAVDGVLEVQNGIISSFLTTACVFIPLAYLGGQMGRVLKVIPVVLLAVLAVSLIEAFWILPNHLSHSLRNQHLDTPGKFKSGFNRLMDWIREHLLGRTVDMAVRYRYLTVGILVALFIISLGTFRAGMLKFVSFPKLDEDSLEVKIYLPPGTPLQRTENVVGRILKGLDETDRHYSELQPDSRRLIQETQVSYSQNADVSESGPHLATIYVDLLGSEARIGALDEILAYWRKQSGKIPDAISISFDTPRRGPSGNAIEIGFRGEDLKELKTAAGEVSNWLIQFDGVYDLYDNLRPGKPEIQMKLKPGASLLNLSAAAIANQLGSAFQGTTAEEIQIGRNAYEIDVRLKPESRDSLADLDRFKLTGAKGGQIPLESVVEMTAGRGYSAINHVDGTRTVTLFGSINMAVANTREIMNRLENEMLPKLQQAHPNVQVLIMGESKNSAETGSSMIKALVIGLMGIFILLSFQFRSFMEPLVVMLAIPFSLIGVIWGHLIMGLPLSMPSMLGYISLTGIVVNDSILLVIFIRNRINEGKDIESAARAASRERFRAVLLTSVTTIIGLVPLLSETSLQAQMIVPIATSIAFGMAASTILILIAIPCFYSILGDFGLTRKTVARDDLIHTDAINQAGGA